MFTSASIQQQQQHFDAVVVGGGWAGLITALRLSEAKQSVLVLEARPRLGGRAFTHTFDDSTKGSSQRTVRASKGDDVDGAQPASSTSGGSSKWWEQKGVESIDFGCSWIHGYEEGNPAKELCQQLGIPVSIPEPAKVPGSIVGPDGKVLPAQLAQRITSNLDKAMAAAKKVARADARSPGADESLASFLLVQNSPLFEGLSSAEERKLATSYARSLHIPLGTTLEHVALRWTGFEQNFAGTDAAPEGGFSRVVQALADQITAKGGAVQVGKEVSQLERAESGVKITTKNNDSVTAKLAVCTLPLAVLKRAVSSSSSLFQPSLSPRKLEVIQRVNVGNLNKVLLAYDGPAWWDDQIPSFTLLPSRSEADATQLDQILQSTTLVVSATAASPSSGSSKLLVMVGGPAAKQLEAFERPQVVDALHRYISPKIAKSSSSSPSAPSHNFMSRWSGHALTGGATTSPVVVGQDHSPLDFGEYSEDSGTPCTLSRKRHDFDCENT